MTAATAGAAATAAAATPGPTGEQFRITHQNTETGTTSSAIITELAASLRELFLSGIESTQSHAADVLPPMGDGIILVPWPNRIAGGRWQLDGKTQQLDITEPASGNAIHGLLRNTAYRMGERSESSITLHAAVFPQHGYPFLLDTSVQYSLDDSGLTVTHTIINRSASRAPVAVGAHPYLKVGSVPTEDLVLTVDAATQFEVDDRAIPSAEVSLDGSEFDLRAGRLVGDVDIDHGYGKLGTQGGETVHTVTAPDGSGTELWADENFAFVQVFTPKIFPREDGLGAAVAIEPMTAPANAFNTGEGLRWLEPGETWMLRWGIRHRN